MPVEFLMSTPMARPCFETSPFFQEAGGSLKALEKTFHNLEPNASGKLLLTFVPVRDYACPNAIEVEDE
jgi:hypothetical protein